MRWSFARESWLLELRYARPTLHPKLDVGMSHDTIIRRRDGYMLLGEYPPDQLPSADRIIHTLQRNSIERLGLSSDPAKAAAQLADRLDAADAARAEAEREKRKARLLDLGSEAYDDYIWAEKARVGLALHGKQ